MQRAVNFIQQAQHLLVFVFGQHISQPRSSGQQLLADVVDVNRFTYRHSLPPYRLIEVRGLRTRDGCSFAPLTFALYSPSSTASLRFLRAKLVDSFGSTPPACGSLESSHYKLFPGNLLSANALQASSLFAWD